MDGLTRARHERVQFPVRLSPYLWTSPLEVCIKVAPVLHRRPSELLTLIGLAVWRGTYLELVCEEPAGLGK